MSVKPLVTVIIPNYKTAALTKLCLRSLRKYTDCSRIKVLVVDNDSQDESTEYLRSLSWITLIERKTGSESGPEMHVKALDQAMGMVTTPLVLIMHTDTIVISPDWLDFLLSRMNRTPNTVGVGSWKLETVPPLKIFFKRIENTVRRLLGRKILDREHYFRSHCALYKSDAVRENGGFYDGESAGVNLFKKLQEKGYDLPFIDSEELCRYIRHLNHATMILNPKEGDRKTASPRMRRKLNAELRKLKAQEILQDDSLDR